MEKERWEISGRWAGASGIGASASGTREGTRRGRWLSASPTATFFRTCSSVQPTLCAAPSHFFPARGGAVNGDRHLHCITTYLRPAVNPHQNIKRNILGISRTPLAAPPHAAIRRQIIANTADFLAQTPRDAGRGRLKAPVEEERWKRVAAWTAPTPPMAQGRSQTGPKRSSSPAPKLVCYGSQVSRRHSRTLPSAPSYRSIQVSEYCLTLAYVTHTCPPRKLYITLLPCR